MATDITQSAIKAIGDEAPSDWTLTPSEHANSLPPEAGALRRVLERSTLQETVRAFEVSDSEATHARDRYKRLSVWAEVLSIIAILLAAFVLVTSANRVPESWNIELPKYLSLEYVVPWIGAIQGFCLVASFFLLWLVRNRGHYQKWMSARGRAEWNRLKLFKTVSRSTEQVRDGELPLPPLKLEYFRRYQLDVQRKYYRERGREHERALFRRSVLYGLWIALVVVAALPVIVKLPGLEIEAWLNLAAFDPRIEYPDLSQRALIALTTIAAGIKAWLTASAHINQDERNAARYFATSENLEWLADRALDDARTAAAKGEISEVHSYVDIVQEYISAEHREWVLLRRVTANRSLKAAKEAGLVQET